MTTEPIRDKKQLKKLAAHFLEKGELRNYVLIVLGVYTALRISDLLRLTWEDVYDFEEGCFRSHISLVEKKTGKPKMIALNKQAIQALKIYFPKHSGKFIFSNGRKKENHISRVQAWRITKAGVKAVSISGRISCHSLRKTFGYRLFKEKKISPVILMELFNHSSFEVTKRYLGITQDDLDSAYMGLDLF